MLFWPQTPPYRLNCNLVIKFADDDYRHFSNKADLEAMFDSVDVEDEDV